MDVVEWTPCGGPWITEKQRCEGRKRLMMQENEFNSDLVHINVWFIPDWIHTGV